MNFKKLHWLLWFLALLIHIILFISIWDMFPTVPDYRDLRQSIELRHKGIGKRVVIFLIGGLNVTLFYNMMRISAYERLREAISEKGSWGIAWSNSGGSYENLLTLISGVESNDVPWFNKTGNQPDLVTSNVEKVTFIGAPYFKYFKERDNWDTYTYPEEWSNFTRHYNDLAMDSWVLNCTKEVLNKVRFSKTTRNSEIYIIYFEGLKTINKYDGKNSPKVRTAAKRILMSIEELIGVFNQVYNEAGNTFILTSDFVRADIKDYADDKISEFLFPVMAWGAGIDGQGEKTSFWSLKSKDRRDIEYKNIAPLIACILGLSTPAHSTGRISFNYLDNDLSFRARCALSNIKQLYNLCVEECDRINNKALIKLSKALDTTGINYVNKLYEVLAKSIDKGQYIVVVNKADRLLNNLQDLTSYYKYFYPRVTKIIIFIIYLGWLIYLSSFLFNKPNLQVNAVVTRNNAQNVNNAEQKRKKENEDIVSAQKPLWKRILVPSLIMKFILEFLYIIMSLAVLIIAILSAWPVTMICYLSVMFTVLWGVLKFAHRWRLCKTTLLNQSEPVTGIKFSVFFMSYIMLIVFPMETTMYTAALILTLLTLPYSDYLKVKNCFLGDWMLSSIFLLFFMSYGNDFQTNIIENIAQIMFLAGFCFAASVLLQIKLIDFPLVVLALFSVILATITNCLIKEGIISNTLWLWILALPLVFVIIIGSNTVSIRLLQNGISLCIPYILAANSYEPLTYFFVYLHLATWFVVETYRNYVNYEKVAIFHEIPLVTETTFRNIQWCDGRRAFLCILYILSSYIALNNEKNLLNIFTGMQLTKISSYTPLVSYIFKLSSQILTVTMFYQLIGKFTKTSNKSMLLCLLLLLEVMGFIELTFAIIGNAFSSDLNAITNYIFSQFIILAYLLTYPITLWIISPSLLSWINVCATPQNDSDITMSDMRVN